MKEWLILAFIFFIGSLAGWVLELIFRRFFSKANPTRKWINPGFLVGPYLPLYGFSLCVVYLLAHINVSFIHEVYLRKTVLFLLMALSVTLIEYFAGLIFIKGMHVKLWDYSDEKWNIQGIICPKFTLFWYLLSAIYYFLIHPNIIHSIEWLAGNLWFSFFVGLFYGVFLIDVCYSLNILNNIQKFAKENDIIVQYEAFRKHIGELRNDFKEKERFIFSMKLDHISIKKSLKAYFDKYYK